MMDLLNAFFLNVDAVLIFFFRLSDTPIVGYLVGSAFLAGVCVLCGQATIFTAFSVNKNLIRGQNQEMVRMQNLSVYALLAKNKKAFKACNRQANDAFGKVFFSQIALSASTLWPIPFGLAWMQTRFTDVQFQLPFTDYSVGYAFTFIPMYILVYILFGKIKRRLPGFSAIEKKIDAVVADTEEMVSFADLAGGPGSAKPSQIFSR
jgi:hypothetical protein